MKKVININFQGRVIPIEESAYDILKQYVESLRRFFANEEGRDEIINDIEGRIAELFGEKIGQTLVGTQLTINAPLSAKSLNLNQSIEKCRLRFGTPVCNLVIDALLSPKIG